MTLPLGDTPVIVSDAAARPPLVLDLDNALLRTDLLHETAVAYLKGNPLRLFQLALWLLRGKAVLKRALSERVVLDVEGLPVNEALVAFGQAEAAAGRLVGVASASDALLAHRVARRFGFTDFVIASDGVSNFKGDAKRQQLQQRFPNGFSYAADAAVDLAVWRHAQTIVLAGASPGTARAAARLGKPIEASFENPGLGLRGWRKALRVHQWAKNALVFVPLILSGMASEPQAMLSALIAFAAMSVLASGTYLINDLFDLGDDRRHWSKRERPLASGRMRITQGVAASAVLIAAGLAAGAVLGTTSLLLLAFYMAATLAYSLYLKRQPIVDAFTLAVLFTTRLGLGIAAVGAAPSAWLLVFSMFLFASLSFAKRQTEIQRSIANGRSDVGGRGYRTGDSGLVLAMGIATGMTAVTIMVLYIINDAFSAQFYKEPVFLWAFPAVLFMWISRIWLLCHREELHDDPVAFAVRDRVSIVLGGIMAAAFLAGWVL